MKKNQTQSMKMINEERKRKNNKITFSIYFSRVISIIQFL